MGVYFKLIAQCFLLFRANFKTLIQIVFIYPSPHSRLSDSPPRLRLAFAVLREGFLALPQRVITRFRPRPLPLLAAFRRLGDSFEIASSFKFF